MYLACRRAPCTPAVCQPLCRKDPSSAFTLLGDEWGDHREAQSFHTTELQQTGTPKPCKSCIGCTKLAQPQLVEVLNHSISQ